MEYDEREKGKYDIVITTDNDVDFKTQDWLKTIIDIWERQKIIVLSPYIEGLKDNPGGAPRTGLKEAGVPERGYVGKHLIGFPRQMGNIVNAFPRKFFDGFKFDENTFKHGTQTFQVANAAFSRGYVLGYMESVIVEHMDTTIGQEKKHPEEFKKALEAKTIKYETIHN